MPEYDAKMLGVYLRKARSERGFTQSALAQLAHIPRLRLLRAEMGVKALGFDEVIRVAKVLRLPVQRLMDGNLSVPNDVQGIAFELNQLGIWDLEVSDPVVPGSFRHPSQVIVLALRGDTLLPRVVDALPFVLARKAIPVPLTLAFADTYDPRIRHRLAWLCDVTRTLGKMTGFPSPRSVEMLDAFIAAAEKPTSPDSLGYPRPPGPVPPVWRRWNITYSGSLEQFHSRASELNARGG